MWFRRAAASRSLSFYGDLEFVLFTSWHNWQLAYRMIWSGTSTKIPIWDDDSSPIRTGSIFHSRLPTSVLLPFQTKTCNELKLDWHRFTQIPVGSGVTLRHDVICEIHHINFTILYNSYTLSYVDSLDVNFRCRKGIKPDASKKKKTWKEASVISGFHDELRQWWNLYHKIFHLPSSKKKAINFSLYSSLSSLLSATYSTPQTLRFLSLNITFKFDSLLINNFHTNTITIDKHGQS